MQSYVILLIKIAFACLVNNMYIFINQQVDLGAVIFQRSLDEGLELFLDQSGDTTCAEMDKNVLSA